MGYNNEWLDKQLKERRVKINDVFLMTVTDLGEINIIMKDGSF